MGFQEQLNFWVYENPLVTVPCDVAKFAGKQVVNTLSTVAGPILPKTLPPAPQVIVMEPLPLWKLAGSANIFIRIAGLSGATAVALGAYGAHAKFDKTEDEKARVMFEAANKYHFIHTVGLLGVPLCHYPRVTGSLFILGMLMFCGTCYYRAVTGDTKMRKITPIGGTLLIVAWLTMAL